MPFCSAAPRRRLRRPIVKFTRTQPEPHRTLSTITYWDELVFELRHIFTLPHLLPLTHLDARTGLPLDKHSESYRLLELSEFDADPEAIFDVDNMPGDDFDSHGVVGREGENAPVDPSKSNQYKVRVEELSGMIDSSTIAGSRSFQELSLYEKKSVLINQELEWVPLGIKVGRG